MDDVGLGQAALAILIYYGVVFCTGFAVTFVLVYLLIKRVLPSQGVTLIRSRLDTILLAFLFAMLGGFAFREFVEWRNAEYTERGQEEFQRRKEEFIQRQFQNYHIVSLQQADENDRILKFTFTVPEDGRYDLLMYADLPPEEQRRANRIIPERKFKDVSEDGEGLLFREWGGENYDPDEKSYDTSGIYGESLLSETRHDMRLFAGNNSVFFRVPKSLPKEYFDGLDFYVDLEPHLQSETEVLHNTTKGFAITNAGAPEMYEEVAYHSPDFDGGCPPRGSAEYVEAACATDKRLNFKLGSR